MWVTKLLISPGKIGILPEIGLFVLFGPGLAGSFDALLVGWSVVVARGPYLARQIFTLFKFSLLFLYHLKFSGDSGRDVGRPLEEVGRETAAEAHTPVYPHQRTQNPVPVFQVYFLNFSILFNSSFQAFFSFLIHHPLMLPKTS